VCVVANALVFLPNKYDKEPFEKVAERGAGVKRSETSEQRKFANPSCRTRLGEAQYKREPQHGASKETDVERAGSKTQSQCKQI